MQARSDRTWTGPPRLIDLESRLLRVRGVNGCHLRLLTRNAHPEYSPILPLSTEKLRAPSLVLLDPVTWHSANSFLEPATESLLHGGRQAPSTHPAHVHSKKLRRSGSDSEHHKAFVLRQPPSSPRRLRTLLTHQAICPVEPHLAFLAVSYTVQSAGSSIDALEPEARCW